MSKKSNRRRAARGRAAFGPVQRREAASWETASWDAESPEAASWERACQEAARWEDADSDSPAVELSGMRHADAALEAPDIPADPALHDARPSQHDQTPQHEQTPHDGLWRDAESLVTIARRHAVLAAGPPDARADRLAACRTVWINYAAAFNNDAAARERFADELLDATRAFMAMSRKSDGAPPEPQAESPAPWHPQVAVSVMTLDELRLMLHQIIRQ